MPATKAPTMSVFKDDDMTALTPPWSVADYLAWQREQEAREDDEREAMNRKILARFDPETEAAVRAAEEGWVSKAV